MVELDRILTDVLARAEPTVTTAPSIARALRVHGRGGDLRLDVLHRLAFSDPAIATELLSAANAGGGEVASLPKAVERIGEATFLRIVRSAAAGEPLAAHGPLAAQRQRAWRSSVVSAILCRELALARGLDGDEAYACGLLHDVGRLAALAALERLAAGARAGAASPARRWDRLAGRWHVALGAALAERRGLPRNVFEAIAFHHPEQATPAAPSEMLRVVRSVDALVAVLLETGSSADAAVEVAGLTDGEAARLARAIEAVQLQVASLERAPSPVRLAATPRPEPAPLHEPRGSGVRLRLAGREYLARGFAANQLLVSGPAPLGEGALLEVEVLDRARAPFHVRVLACWDEGGRFGALLVPFGLSGPSLVDFAGMPPPVALA